MEETKPTSETPHTTTGGKKVRQQAPEDKGKIEKDQREPSPRQFKSPSGHEVRK